MRKELSTGTRILIAGGLLGEAILGAGCTPEAQAQKLDAENGKNNPALVSNDSSVEAVLPSLVPTIEPTVSVEQLLEQHGVIAIQNEALQKLKDVDDADGRMIYESYQGLINQNEAWKEKKVSDFELTVLAHDTPDNLPESILFGTLGNQTFVLGRSKQGIESASAINAPLMIEETEEGVTYYYQDKKNNRVDLFWDGELDGEPGVEFTLIDGTTSQFFPDSQLSEGIKETPDAIVADLSPAKLAKYVNLIYENGAFVKKDDARLIVGKLDTATGEWTELRDGMTEEEREEYKNMYSKCTENGVLVSTECAVVPEADFRSGKVLKHILALMDDMPPLPENTVENVKMIDGSGRIFITPKEVPADEDLPYDLINVLLLDDPTIFSLQTKKPILTPILYVRVHNKDGSYGVLVMRGGTQWLDSVVLKQEKGKVQFSPTITDKQMNDAVELMKKINAKEEVNGWSYWILFHYPEVEAWLDDYVETGNVPRGLAQYHLTAMDFSKAKGARLVE